MLLSYEYTCTFVFQDASFRLIGCNNANFYRLSLVYIVLVQLNLLESSDGFITDLLLRVLWFRLVCLLFTLILKKSIS